MLPHDPGSPVERPKVLFVDHVPEVFGGAEINLIELLDWERSRRAWDSTVACAPGSRLRSVLESKGIRCCDYTLPPTLSGLRVVGRRFQILKAFRGWRALRQGKDQLGRIVRRFSPDAVISVTNKDHLVSGSVCRKHLARSIWWVNDLMTPEFFSWPVRQAFFHRAKLHGDCLVAVSECCRSAILQGGLDPSRVEVVPNGVDLRHYPFRDRPSHGVSGVDAEASDWKVGLIGRIAPWKGHHVFMDMAERWKQLGRKGEFWIVGDVSAHESEFGGGASESTGERGFTGECPVPTVSRGCSGRVVATGCLGPLLNPAGALWTDRPGGDGDGDSGGSFQPGRDSRID